MSEGDYFAKSGNNVRTNLPGATLDQRIIPDSGLLKNPADKPIMNQRIANAINAGTSTGGVGGVQVLSATPREQEIAAQQRQRTGPGMTAEKQRGLMDQGRASMERSLDRASQERIGENQAQIMADKNAGVIQVPVKDDQGKTIGMELRDKRTGQPIEQPAGQEPSATRQALEAERANIIAEEARGKGENWLGPKRSDRLAKIDKMIQDEDARGQGSYAKQTQAAPMTQELFNQKLKETRDPQEIVKLKDEARKAGLRVA
jgi:hypothetical protein